jgi:hypothetical protein
LFIFFIESASRRAFKQGYPFSEKPGLSIIFRPFSTLSSFSLTTHHLSLFTLRSSLFSVILSEVEGHFSFFTFHSSLTSAFQHG